MESGSQRDELSWTKQHLMVGQLCLKLNILRWAHTRGEAPRRELSIFVNKITLVPKIHSFLFKFCLSVVSLANFVASFGVDKWNPTNVGSHSTDGQSHDQWVKRGNKSCVCEGGECLCKSNIQKINVKVSG